MQMRAIIPANPGVLVADVDGTVDCDGPMVDAGSPVALDSASRSVVDSDFFATAVGVGLADVDGDLEGELVGTGGLFATG